MDINTFQLYKADLIKLDSNDGYNILFDDSSISRKENKSNRARVNRAARRKTHEI